MRVVIIVQARMGSTRLPEKIMKKILGKTLLEYLLERLKRVNSADEICVATTTTSAEQPIVDICSRMAIKTFRGSEKDVLERTYLAAKESRADVIVRVTSDCPLMDPSELDKLIVYFLNSKDKLDYASNALQRSYPRGMEAEVFSFDVLEKAHNSAKEDFEREHVTPYINLNPNIFRLGNVAYSENHKDYRWTVDTSDDFELISKIIEALYPVKSDFSIKDILDLLAKNPEWAEINSHVKQKVLRE